MMSVIFVSMNATTRRMKAVIDRDTLPPDATKMVEFYSTANLDRKGDRSERFWHFYDKMKWLELFGFEICIDFGDYFYETGMPSPEVR